MRRSERICKRIEKGEIPKSRPIKQSKNGDAKNWLSQNVDLDLDLELDEKNESAKGTVDYSKPLFETKTKKKKRPKNIVLNQCFLCQKDKRTIHKSTKRKLVERLVSCETNGKTIIIQAAKIRQQQQQEDKTAARILSVINDKDPECLDLKYHRSCYKRFVRCMYVASRQAHPHALDPTFQIFSNEVIQKRIIDNGEVFRLSKLRDMFVDMVEAVEDTKLDKNNYKTSQLKKRIKKRFPELTYIKQSIHTSEIVLYNESKSNLILDLSNIDGTSDSEPDDVNTHNSGSRFYTNLSKTRDLYVSSQILKNSLLASKSLDSWPLTHLDISIEKVETIVPPELFNFIAWCSNQNTSNDEIYSDTFVSVKKELKLKILAICQDLIFLSSSGKKATPKHVGLSLAVRHLTGSSKIIDLLNYHGHCMSRSFTLEHDTALAQQQMLNMESIPGGFRKNCFTTLVWDNNDFGEETLSGKGTTHNTNGIIVQRKDSFVQPEVFSQGSISRTRKRRLSECDTHIEEYYPSAKRQGPPLLLDNDLQPLSDNTAVCPLQQDDDPQIQNQEIALVESVDKALYFAKFVQV